MPKHDQLYRYLFEQDAVRGELVTLSKTYNAVLNNHDYPVPVQRLMGEMLVVTSLLTATLKFVGEITLQLQGDGPLSFAVINGNNEQEMRGLARYNAEIDSQITFRDMISNGYLIITITPKEGERYQGIVALEGESLAESIEHYFMQSEQLLTRLFLRVGEEQGEPVAGGMLLQVLPSETSNNEAFEHLAQLTNTITTQELATLTAEEILHRLYHQEEVTLFAPQAVNYCCTCSKARCAQTLMALSPQELAELLELDGHIMMHCDFCGNDYDFDTVDIEALSSCDTNNTMASETIH